MFKIDVYTERKQYNSVYYTLRDLQKNGHPFQVNSVDLDNIGNKNSFIEIILDIKLSQTIFEPKNGLFEENKRFLDLLRTTKAKLILNLSLEGHTHDLFAYIHRYIRDYDIPSDKIIYLNGTRNIEEIYRVWAINHNIKSKIQCFNLLTFNFAPYMKDSSKKLKELPKTRHYICPNRRIAEQRLLTVYELINRNLVDKGHVSFYRTDDYGHNIKTPLLHQDYTHKVYSTLKYDMSIDDIDPMVNQADGHSADISDFYESACFSVVTETYFHHKEIFHSEKSFRPMLYKHPMIIIGSRFMLRGLRELGYKTFYGIIDESYDDIPNAYKRFKAAMYEIEKLCALPLPELEDKINSINDVLEHNRNWLLKHRHEQTLNTSFINIVFNFDK